MDVAIVASFAENLKSKAMMKDWRRKRNDTSKCAYLGLSG